MAKLYVNYNKLIDSVDILENMSSKVFYSLSDDIKKYVDSINKIGIDHDDCFSSITTTKMLSSISSTSEDIDNLIYDIYQAISTTSLYSDSSDSKLLTIFDKQYSITQLKTVGLVDSFKWLLSNDSVKLSDKVSKGILKPKYDHTYYNELLKKFQASSSQRDQVVSNAIFLSMFFPHMSYFWGGGHQYNIEGVDPLWGTKKVVELKGDDNTGKSIPYSLDCSGFIDWALYNSGFDSNKVNCLSTTSSYSSLGNVENITEKNIITRIKPGDLVHMDGHAGIIVAKNNKDIIVAHCSGSGNGMNLTSIDTKTGLVVDDSNIPDRIGKEYFTSVIEMNYDEKK